jgi:hypothetical protein
MALYSAGFSVAGVNTANTVLANLKAAASDRLRLIEVGVFIAVAPTTAPDLVLVRMSAVGTGAITTATSVLHDTGEGAVTGTLETAWATTRPTVTGGHARRALLPLTIGAGVIWSFGPGLELVVNVSAGLCLQNINASGATLGTLNGYFMWNE